MGSPIINSAAANQATGTPQSVDQAAQYIGQNGLAPAYTSGSTVSSDTGQIAPPIPQKQGRLKQLLLNMAQGSALAMGYEAGIPQAQALQTETAIRRQQLPYAGAQAQANLGLTQSQATESALNNQITLARLQALRDLGNNGNPFSSLGKLSQDEQSLADAARSQAMASGTFQPITDAIGKIYTQRQIFGRGEQSGKYTMLTVTPQMVSAGVPAQFLGTQQPSGLLQPYLNRAVFGNVAVQGAQGPALVNRNPMSSDFGAVRDLKLGSPAQAGAYWNAKFGLVKTVDDNGSPVYESRLQAPGAPVADNTFNIMKGKAGLDNFKDALGRISTNLDVMNDPTQRALIARTLRNIGTNTDPGIIWSTLGAATESGLDQRAADLVAATLNAREWIGANRSFAGNFRGSEALYQRMVANVAGPMNTDALNKALIKQDLDNTSRVEGMLGRFQGQGKSQQGNKAPSGGNKTWFSGIQGAVAK